MNSLNAFRVIRVVQTFLSEPVTTISTNIPLNIAIFGVADAVLPAFFASAFRTCNS